MQLRITAFRGSPWITFNTHEAILDVRNADPDSLLGAHLVWRTETGRVVRGKVVRRHGHATSMKLLARFHKGLPGQAIGQTVEVRPAQAKAEKRASVRPAPAKAAKPAAPPKPAAKPASKKPAKGPAKGKAAAKKA